MIKPKARPNANIVAIVEVRIDLKRQKESIDTRVFDRSKMSSINQVPGTKRHCYWSAPGTVHIVEHDGLNRFCSATNNHGLSYLRTTGHRTLAATN